jgi:hypothetical protein
VDYNPTTGTLMAAIADNKDLEKKLAELMAFQRRTISGVVGTGKILTEIKEQLDHGEFTAWIKENCGWSHATTLRYRRSFEWANTIDDFEDLNLTIMALYYCADAHAKMSEFVNLEHRASAIYEAGLAAVVTAARERLIDMDEADRIYGAAFLEEYNKVNAIVPEPEADTKIDDEAIEGDDDDSTVIADEEGQDHGANIAVMANDKTSDDPPLRYVHTTPAGERTEDLPASPLHFQTALHVMFTTHAAASDDEWLEEIENTSSKVEFYKLLDRMIAVRQKLEAGNSPIKMKADRAEAKAKNGR